MTTVLMIVRPPGVPVTMNSLPSLNAIAGLGVSRGRLPGFTSAGCPGSRRDWQPREEIASPVPGMIGVSLALSEVVAE
ncbi:hypothetical protein D3C83_93820 [compost metagenome]